MPDDKKQDVFDWLMSLNPVVIDVDEEGNFTDSSQVEDLKNRIKEEVKEIGDSE
jgi:hypothetical protein